MSKKSHSKAPESLKKDNSVGNTVNRNNRTKAIKNLSEAKELEAERLKKGYQWLTNGKSTIFAAPTRIGHHLHNGYRVINP